MRDWAKYIGVPYKERGRDRDGWDCLGLTRIVLRDEIGFEIPSFDEHYAQAYDAEQTQRIARGEAALRGESVALGDERTFDVILFKGLPLHCGVVIEPGFMLHVRRGGVGTCKESYLSRIWREKIDGFWRPLLDVGDIGVGRLSDDPGIKAADHALNGIAPDLTGDGLMAGSGLIRDVAHDSGTSTQKNGKSEGDHDRNSHS